MRRAPIVLVGTAAGLAGVLLFHPRSTGPSLSTLPAASGGTTGSGASAPNAKSGASANSSGPAGSGDSSSSSSTGTSGSATTTTYIGTAVTYGYGVLSVRITVSGRKLTKVGIASLTDGSNFRSQSIDQQAIPVLEKQALTAQGAKIQGVSGASYTSEGFARSLQSALGKAGL